MEGASKKGAWSSRSLLFRLLVAGGLVYLAALFFSSPSSSSSSSSSLLSSASSSPSPSPTDPVVPTIPAVERFMRGHLVPSFIIIGAQKAGTTSLFRYLLNHPQVLPLEQNPVTGSGEDQRPLKATGAKEIRFFGFGQLAKGLDRYISFFPDKSQLEDLPNPRPVIIGEASPGYIFQAKAAQEIFSMFPKMRLIALLRNPADRANSQYYHALLLRKNRTAVPIEEYIKMEERVIQGCLERLPEVLTSKEMSVHLEFMECHRNLSVQYLEEIGGKRSWNMQLMLRGLYLPQIIPYLTIFPRNQLLFIKSEDFFGNPQKYMKTVTQFLGISDFDWDEVVKSKFNFVEHNDIAESKAQAAIHPPLHPDIRARIERIMEPFNRRLGELIGITWETTTPHKEATGNSSFAL